MTPQRQFPFNDPQRRADAFAEAVLLHEDWGDKQRDKLRAKWTLSHDFEAYQKALVDLNADLELRRWSEWAYWLGETKVQP